MAQKDDHTLQIKGLDVEIYQFSSNSRNPQESTKFQKFQNSQKIPLFCKHQHSLINFSNPQKTQISVPSQARKHKLGNVMSGTTLENWNYTNKTTNFPISSAEGMTYIMGSNRLNSTNKSVQKKPPFSPIWAKIHIHQINQSSYQVIKIVSQSRNIHEVKSW